MRLGWRRMDGPFGAENIWAINYNKLELMRMIPVFCGPRVFANFPYQTFDSPICAAVSNGHD